MPEHRFDDRLESDLRDALRLEFASVRVGVSAPQVRGRISARERARRAQRLVLLSAAAVLAVLVAIPVLSGLVLTGPLAPAPTSGVAEPATVAAIEAGSGDLVLSRAWPDGRSEVVASYAGALDLLRRATGEANASSLPDDAVATVGPGGSLAVGLPSGDILVLTGRPDGDGFVSRARERSPFVTWIGWAPDGRLAIVDDRLIVRLVDPTTARETTAALPERVLPESRFFGPALLLTWSDEGRIVAQRSNPATFQSEMGVVDVTAERPAFVPGRPSAIRATTGVEPRWAADGSAPGTSCEDERPVSACAGLSPWSSSGSEMTDSWFVAEPNDAVTDVVRTADGSGLLVVVRATDADQGRLVVVDAPGSWRGAVVFDAPACRPQDCGSAYVAGVAPGGRSVVAWTPGGLVIGDLATGAATTLPAGTLFVGWLVTPEVATDTLLAVPPCDVPREEDVAAITLSDAATSPASAGVLPVVGDRADADPWRVDEMTGSDPLVVDPTGRLVLGLPVGLCAEAARIEALAPAGLPYAVPGNLRSWTAGEDAQAGLVPISSPESGGDWIVRARLWLTGAEREAILLYRVTTTGPAKPAVTPAPGQPSTEP